MKKVNPKVVALVLMLLSGLIAGAKIADDIIGQPAADPVELEADPF